VAEEKIATDPSINFSLKFLILRCYLSLLKVAPLVVQYTRIFVRYFLCILFIQSIVLILQSPLPPSLSSHSHFAGRFFLFAGKMVCILSLLSLCCTLSWPCFVHNLQDKCHFQRTTLYICNIYHRWFCTYLY